MPILFLLNNSSNTIGFNLDSFKGGCIHALCNSSKISFTVQLRHRKWLWWLLINNILTCIFSELGTRQTLPRQRDRVFSPKLVDYLLHYVNISRGYASLTPRP